MRTKEQLEDIHNRYQSYGWVEAQYKDLTKEEKQGIKDCLVLQKYPANCTIIYVPYDRYLIL